MSYASYNSQIIDISKIPHFFSYGIKDEQTIKRDRRNRLIRLMIIGSVISAIAGRVLQDQYFDYKLVKNHRNLDKIETRLAELKSQAFINDNYKNINFRKEYLSLHEMALSGRKQHIYQQTNTTFNILRKHHGFCDECEKLRKIGYRTY